MRFAFWRSEYPPVKIGGDSYALSVKAAGVRIKLFPWLLLLTVLSCITAIAQLVVLLAVWEEVHVLNQQVVLLRFLLEPIRVLPVPGGPLT